MILDDNYEIILLILSWKHRFFSLPGLSGSQSSLKSTNAPASLSVTSPFSVVRRQQCSAWPIKAKFHVEPPLEGGTKVYINGLGHMTKMAVMPIYG